MPEQRRLDRGPCVVKVFPAARPPRCDKQLRELLHRDVSVVGRSEIPARAPLCLRLLEHPCGEREIARERLEHMLPGAYGCGIPQGDRFACRQMAHDVGDDPILSPVTAADDVAGPHGGQLYAMLIQAIRGEETPAVGCRDKFGGSLACAVGIMPAEWIRFGMRLAIGMWLVAFVAGRHNHAARRATVADGVEQRCRADDVG